ncbi:MAG: DUF1653 domain-containing protein [Patescibacteria group bacterium]
MNIPEKGFYRHYKHDPDSSPYNYMYEVIGVGRNTEDKMLMVLYRPLYKNEWMAPADYNARPLDMFMGTVEKDGKMVPRFTHLTNPDLVAELVVVRSHMYSH